MGYEEERVVGRVDALRVLVGMKFQNRSAVALPELRRRRVDGGVEQAVQRAPRRRGDEGGNLHRCEGSSAASVGWIQRTDGAAATQTFYETGQRRASLGQRHAERDPVAVPGRADADGTDPAPEAVGA